METRTLRVERLFREILFFRQVGDDHRWFSPLKNWFAYNWPKFSNPNSWNAALADFRKHEQIPSALELTFKLNPSAVCSVPLLEAHVNSSDAAMATAPLSLAVPIPQARVPAPACQK